MVLSWPWSSYFFFSLDKFTHFLGFTVQLEADLMDGYVGKTAIFLLSSKNKSSSINFGKFWFCESAGVKPAAALIWATLQFMCMNCRTFFPFKDVILLQSAQSILSVAWLPLLQWKPSCFMSVFNLIGFQVWLELSWPGLLTIAVGNKLTVWQL